MAIKKLIISFLFVLPTAMVAQEAEQKPSLDRGTVQEQFRYLIDESNDYQEYKVVKRSWLNKLMANVGDTLKNLQTEISEKSASISGQSEEIQALKSRLARANDSLATTLSQKNSMSFFGASVKKSYYKTIMWSIVGLLFLALLIFIFRFRNSNAASSHAREILANVEEEFAQYKKRSLEREQKLRRELQDEINKQRGV